MILPLVLVVVLLSGVLSVLASRAALTPVATRLMAYKAEQLRDYTLSEWETVESLELDDDEAIRLAAQESFRSYATSIIRSDTELIAVVDHTDRVVMQIGAAESIDAQSMDENREPPDYGELEVGWLSEKFLGRSRVGVVFSLEPFRWKVAVTEREEVFFSDAQEIVRTHIAISLAALLAVSLFVWLFLGFLIRPVERLTRTVLQITRTQDLSQRVAIEYADEVGLLGDAFNGMVESLQSNYAQLEQTMIAEQDARRLAIDREEETLLLLGRASEFRDQETGQHLARIGALSELMFRLLGKSEEEMLMIRRASALHDVGKIGISDSVLLKPGKLTDEEFDLMKRHTTIGFQLLDGSHSDYLQKGADIALTHHEKWNGRGYPAGLAGDEIPLEGRVVGIVDVFDALTSERPYKRAWSSDEARELIQRERDEHFDPNLVDVFCENFDQFRAIVEERETR
ncbi:MAG: HD domain-containing phosphohydrolase [Alkalispirochaeta sp.]